MKKTVSERLERLETMFKPDAVPTFEEFQDAWRKMDKLDQSMCVLNAENIEDFYGDSPKELPRQRTIKEYLLRMGILDSNARSLREEAAELWADEVKKHAKA